MGRVLSDGELRELLGVYALGAVDGDELVQVEELLLEDRDARAELHTLQLGVAWLDHATTGAPMRVWRRIEAQIRSESPRTPNVVPMARPTRRRPAARLLAVAAALVAVVVIGAGVLLVQAGGDGDSSVVARAAAARDDTGARTVSFSSSDGRARGRVVVDPDGTAYLVWTRRPTGGVGQTYQLWRLTSDGPQPAGLLGNPAHDKAFRFGGGTTGIAVTLEPRGGSPAPTSAPLVVGAIS